MKRILPLIIIIAIFGGCSSPIEDFDLRVNTDFLKYTAQIEFVNAADPNTSIDGVTMEIMGADAQYVLEATGEKDFQVTDGKIVLALNPARVITEGTPAVFTIKASAPGFLPVTADAYFRNDEFSQLFTINMIDKNNPPTGVGHNSGSSSLTGDALAAAYTLNVAPGGTKNTGAEITVDAGTEFFDVDGNKISGANLSVNLTHFDASGESSVNAFPGGFVPENVIGANGQPEDIYFNTAGFASIDMTVNNTVVKQFSKPINVSMDVDATVNNPYTGAAIQVGDTIPIWSYDVNTGKWQYEKTGTIVDNGGQLQMQFTTTHLSWYNIDFKGPRCRYGTSTGTVTVQMPGFTNSNADYFYCQMVFASNGQSVSPFSSKVRRLYDGKTIRFFNAPSAQCKFIIYRRGSHWYSKGTKVGESAPFNPCSDQVNVAVNVPAPTTINIDLEGKCPSKGGLIFKPNFYVYYRKKGDTYFSYLTYVRRGIASTSKLELGQAYDFKIWYGGLSHTFEGTPDKTDYTLQVTLDANTCNQIF